jgi:hypothetical protein
MNSLRFPGKCGDAATCIQETQKIFLDNGIVDQSQTQVQRAVTNIYYPTLTRTKFGNEDNVYSGTTNISFLGKTEGQPGGLSRPLRNKF